MNTFLRPHVRALLAHRFKKRYYVISRVDFHHPIYARDVWEFRDTANMREYPPPFPPRRDYWVFPRDYYTYACWNCLEPLEAHIKGKCPFAPTRFLARQKWRPGA